jgi:hypothetical protein
MKIGWKIKKITGEKENLFWGLYRQKMQFRYQV